MEALTTEIMRMIDELQSMNDWQNAHPLDLDGKDSYGYKFESFNAYSTEPLSFTETAMKLETEARKVFNMVRVLNRQSPLFMQMSGYLEKLVSQLGSACITKAVMEQRGENSSVMDNMLCTLTIDSLRGMTALNFRKCYDSYMESQTNYRVNPGALALSIRWSALDRRLLATQEKIELIKSGKLKVDTDNSHTNGDGTLKHSTEPEETVTPVNGGETQSEQITPDNEREAKPSTPLSAKGRALPIDKTAIRGDGSRKSGIEPEETVTPVITDTTGDCHRRPDPEPERDVTSDSVDPVKPAENPESPIPSGSAAAEQTETVPAGASEAPDPYDDIGEAYEEYDDDWYDEDEEDDDLPCFSEDPVRRMSGYWQQHLPRYEYAAKT